MRQKKGRVTAAVLGLIAGVVLTGCGAKLPEISEVQEAGIYLTKEGKVTAFLVETFDKEYYDKAELEAMIRAELGDYNSQARAGEDSGEEVQSVVLKGMLDPREKQAAGQTGTDTITVQLEYATPEDYSGYNGKLLYLGTVAQARMDGYPVNADLVSVSDQSTLTRAAAQEMADSHLLILQENIPVQVPYEVLYVSAGVTAKDNTVIFDAADGSFAYVIMK